MKKAAKNDDIVIDPKQTYYLHKNGISVYPVVADGKTYIEVMNNGTPKFYPKVVAQKDVNDAIAKTIQFYYKKLKETENAK